jgi:hypothetical protein
MEDGIASTVATPPESKSFERLIQEIEGLPIEHRIALAERLMNLSRTGLSLGFGNGQLCGGLIVQINTMDRDLIANVLDSVSERIKQEAKQ